MQVFPFCFLLKGVSLKIYVQGDLPPIEPLKWNTKGKTGGREPFARVFFPRGPKGGKSAAVEGRHFSRPNDSKFSSEFVGR